MQRVILVLYDCWWLLLDCCQHSPHHDVSHRRSEFFLTTLSGSFTKACRERQPAVQESLLTRLSQTLGAVLSVLTFPHLRTYSFSHLYHVNLYGISQDSETLFPSQLPGVALQPLALRGVQPLSILLPALPSCELDISVQTRLYVPARSKLTSITQPTSFVCLAQSRQITGYCLMLLQLKLERTDHKNNCSGRSDYK